MYHRYWHREWECESAQISVVHESWINWMTMYIMEFSFLLSACLDLIPVILAHDILRLLSNSSGGSNIVSFHFLFETVEHTANQQEEANNMAQILSFVWLNVFFNLTCTLGFCCCCCFFILLLSSHPLLSEPSNLAALQDWLKCGRKRAWQSWNYRISIASFNAMFKIFS